MSSDHTQRSVSLQPRATVILAAIGRLDRIVACTKYCADVCPQVAQSGRSIIADSWTAQSGEITDIATIAGMMNSERGLQVITEMTPALL
jgi:hypothetical protein